MVGKLVTLNDSGRIVAQTVEDVLNSLKAWWLRELDWTRAADMETAALTPPERMSCNVENPSRYKIWIDGVGAYLVCLGSRVTIGGPRHDGNSADIPLMANLSRLHATFVRSGENYLLEAHAPAKVADRIVEGAAHLNNNYTLEFGGTVRLKFRVPSVLSATAVLDFVSDHRPSQSVDGVVLMDETCLLGAGRENHIRCPDWSESVLLYRKDGGFRCKSSSDLVIAGKVAGGDAAIEPGDIVTGLDVRFRIEETK